MTTANASPDGEPEPNNMQSKGGKARAKSMTPEQRSESARNAALAKWEKVEGAAKLPQASYGSPDKPLRIGNLEIPCYVLDNEKRVITQGGVLTAFSMSPGTATKGGGDRIANFVNTKSINPHASSVLREMITNPIKFRAAGSLAYGYEATILPEICDAILDARGAGSLNYQQEHIAKQAEILIRAFARVGVIALVDEATGYQDVRDRQALRAILKEYIDGKLYEWTLTFPTKFFKGICRLKNWPWNNGKMPSVTGKYINDLVYGRLTPGLVEELRRLNPRTDKGHKKFQDHRFLTRDIGHPSLADFVHEHIGVQNALEDGAWEKYKRIIDLRYPRMGDTLPLDLGD